MLYYHNEITGDWTTSHKEAVAWYNNGYAVELNKMDMETGALEKCAEWVWQRGLMPSPQKRVTLFWAARFWPLY